ncbi:MAG: radical SAM protein [Acidobacteriota bacterium]
MLIFLTHANHLYSDRKQVKKMQPYPPLQTLMVAALLRESGHEIVFFDCTFNRDFLPALDACEPDLVAVIEDNFNFLTKMCLLENRKLACEMAQAARARRIPAIINSSDSTGNPAAYLAAGFTRILTGEIEDAIVRACAQGDVPASSAPVADLDALPLPAWNLLDAGPYRRAWLEAHGYFSINLAASRGCPYQCNWCSKPIHGNSYRTLSAARTAETIHQANQVLRPDRIWFADDIFALSPRWATEFAGEMTRRGTRVPFKMQSRCDLMTRPTVAALAKAGCAEVWMGAESGSQRVLDRMEKGLRVEQIGAACANLRRHDIRACLFLQFGYLGEEWDDIEATIQMVRDVRPDDIGVSVSYPLPGTRFHQIVQQQRTGELHWSDSADLAMTYNGAFSSDFYRALSEALHLEVREADSSAAIAQAWDRVEALRCAYC